MHFLRARTRTYQQIGVCRRETSDKIAQLTNTIDSVNLSIGTQSQRIEEHEASLTRVRQQLKLPLLVLVELHLSSRQQITKAEPVGQDLPM